jgi:ribonuclease HII
MAGKSLIEFDRLRGSRIAGADEAGRGCLAGPIVAAGVAFDYDGLSEADLTTLTALDDSKRLSADRRIELFSEITRIASAVALISRTAGYIDDHGLHRTNLHCLGSALDRVGGADHGVALSDGYMPLGFEGSCEAVVKGDSTSAAIAAASIIAKVSRDRYMWALAEQHPEYSFEQHVGYATPVHRDAIVKFGPTAFHRRSFSSSAYEQFQLVA